MALACGSHGETTQGIGNQRCNQCPWPLSSIWSSPTVMSTVASVDALTGRRWLALGLNIQACCLARGLLNPAGSLARKRLPSFPHAKSKPARSTSQPMNFRPARAHATPVVPAPMCVSSTVPARPRGSPPPARPSAGSVSRPCEPCRSSQARPVAAWQRAPFNCAP